MLMPPKKSLQAGHGSQRPEARGQMSVVSFLASVMPPACLSSGRSTAAHAMTKATPDQIRVFRHRRLVTTLVILGLVLGGFLSVIGLLNLDVVNRNGQVAVAVCCSTILLMWIVAPLVFTSLYFRCPMCGHCIPSVAVRTPRGVGIWLGHRCNHCDIDFAV
jgi:hypothetical protein